MSGDLLYGIGKLLVLPPATMAAAGLLGLAVRPFARRLGNLLVVFAVLATWLLSTPWVAAMLAAPLERYAAIDLEQADWTGLEAIVVLGGGVYRDAPEYGAVDQVSRLTLERLRHAARVHRASGLDLAVVGGSPVDLEEAEAVFMARALEQDFRVPVRWRETHSRNTAENASGSAAVFPFRRIVLVTHAMHMPRAVRAFTAAGFIVTPAPMGFFDTVNQDADAERWAVSDVLPEIHALAASHYAIYEYVGAAWYAFMRE
ncbi:MAG: YdcF family protein [Gammaproteobacteria bacterium]